MTIRREIFDREIVDNSRHAWLVESTDLVIKIQIAPSERVYRLLCLHRHSFEEKIFRKNTPLLAASDTARIKLKAARAQKNCNKTFAGKISRFIF